MAAVGSKLRGERAGGRPGARQESWAAPQPLHEPREMHRAPTTPSPPADPLPAPPKRIIDRRHALHYHPTPPGNPRVTGSSAELSQARVPRSRQMSATRTIALLLALATPLAGATAQ